MIKRRKKGCIPIAELNYMDLGEKPRDDNLDHNAVQVSVLSLESTFNRPALPRYDTGNIELYQSTVKYEIWKSPRAFCSCT